MGAIKSQEKTYSISLAAQRVGVSQRQLYYWEFIGIVKPVYIPFGSYSYRRYTQRDIDRLLKVKQLLDAGYTLKAAAHKVKDQENGGHSFETHHSTAKQSSQTAEEP